MKPSLCKWNQQIYINNGQCMAQVSGFQSVWKRKLQECQIHWKHLEGIQKEQSVYDLLVTCL